MKEREEGGNNSSLTAGRKITFRALTKERGRRKGAGATRRRERENAIRRKRTENCAAKEWKRIYEVPRICPPSFLSIGMYDRQPNWSHAPTTGDSPPCPIRASFAILSVAPLAVNFCREKKDGPSNFSRHRCAFSAARARVTRSITLSIKAVIYFGPIGRDTLITGYYDSR